ncbi:uroporphyrinogen-III synthase [Microbulbifer thermotolerans]|uniref:uroporphyrinogen-III synthase n=1 Tax=Microbulbifer thermotolerans TaxID=252514 RepID=UPI00224B5CAE|nr:uroporphyrinogen-III synthase [Microbulbifer thermotolerans]MCX2782746.1 uroporphyrinogen-III synthase [Microbulbifer thermotolerans]
MNNVLQGKRILITRPEHQCGDWLALLQSAGARVDSIPMLAIEPIEKGPGWQVLKAQVLDFDQVDHAIFVSRNAVQLGCDWLEDYWPQLPQGPRYYAIGAATTSALRSRGIECVTSESIPDTMDSEALLSLPSLQNVTGQRVLIFRGSGGRTLMGDTLRARGARVDYCELYRRVLPADALPQLQQYNVQPDAISVHSGETLTNLAHCIQQATRPALFGVPVVCPSVRVAGLAGELGFQRATAARNAGDAAMLAALQALLAND